MCSRYRPPCVDADLCRPWILKLCQTYDDTFGLSSMFYGIKLSDSGSDHSCFTSYVDMSLGTEVLEITGSWTHLEYCLIRLLLTSDPWP
jgi:hypothetical protein